VRRATEGEAEMGDLGMVLRLVLMLLVNAKVLERPPWARRSRNIVPVRIIGKDFGSRYRTVE
jgi:hypothetical protein